MSQQGGSGPRYRLISSSAGYCARCVPGRARPEMDDEIPLVNQEAEEEVVQQLAASGPANNDDQPQDEDYGDDDDDDEDDDDVEVPDAPQPAAHLPYNVDAGIEVDPEYAGFCEQYLQQLMAPQQQAHNNMAYFGGAYGGWQMMAPMDFQVFSGGLTIHGNWIPTSENGMQCNYWFGFENDGAQGAGAAAAAAVVVEEPEERRDDDGQDNNDNQINLSS